MVITSSLIQGLISESLTMNSAFPATITRHSSDLHNKVQNQFLAVHDPNVYFARLQESFGSNIGILRNYNSFTISFLFPYEYNARHLPSSFRMFNCGLTGFLKYLPYNTDDYCLLHTIYAGEGGVLRGKSLNNDAGYMAGFSKWFLDNNLEDFNLDRVVDLERRLDVNINFYTFEKKKPELFFRSAYKQDDSKIFNIVVIPMGFFYDNNKKGPKFSQKDITSVITPSQRLNTEHGGSWIGKDFISAVGVKNIIRRREAHCALLDTGIFRARKKGSNQIVYKNICKYCTGCFGDSTINNHEKYCKESYSTGSKRDRMKVYIDLAPAPGAFLWG